MRHVLAQRGCLVGAVEHLRHRFHILRIELVELLDVRQNLAEILAHT